MLSGCRLFSCSHRNAIAPALFTMPSQSQSQSKTIGNVWCTSNQQPETSTKHSIFILEFKILTIRSMFYVYCVVYMEIHTIFISKRQSYNASTNVLPVYVLCILIYPCACTYSMLCMCTDGIGWVHYAQISIFQIGWKKKWMKRKKEQKKTEIERKEQIWKNYKCSVITNDCMEHMQSTSILACYLQ